MPIKDIRLKSIPISLAIFLGFSLRWNHRQLEIRTSKTAWMTIEGMHNLMVYIENLNAI